MSSNNENSRSDMNVAPRRGDRNFQLESLILAQNERWRRA
jgi:hypothetical protein